MARRPAQVTEDDILVTCRLYSRPARQAALDSELEAHRELSALMTVDPQLAIERFLELALELCPAAGSAGLSELGHGEDAEPIFTWTAISGALAPWVGGTTPRDFSPCGLCLDHHHPILVDRPGRLFTYFNEAGPEIAEGLVVPLYDTGKKPIGTLWIISHEAGKGFDATDARIMEHLAVQLVLAIKLRRKARLLVQLEQVSRDKDVLVQEVHHRVKNTIQMTSALLHLQERGLSSAEARTALKEAQSRMLVMSKVYEALLQPSEGSVAEVEVGALIDSLVAALRDGGAHSGRVQLRTDCARLAVDAGLAVPIGLIVNEAVTNALKHAFPGRRSGNIAIELKVDESLCSLEVRDDGVGLKEPMREGSLGMRLMRSLARQLGARLTLTGEGGTCVAVEWRLTKARARESAKASA
jgi:two-component sensor histidine kinase